MTDKELALIREALDDPTLSAESFRVLVESLVNPTPITPEDVQWAQAAVDKRGQLRGR